MESEQQFGKEDNAEFSDDEQESFEPTWEDQREILESELDLPRLQDDESVIDEQTILESERDIIQDALSSPPRVQDEFLQPSSSKSNGGYSLGSAWERTRRVLEREDDGEISISSDDTTSSIPAIAIAKARVAREESVEM